MICVKGGYIFVVMATGWLLRYSFGKEDVIHRIKGNALRVRLNSPKDMTKTGVAIERRSARDTLHLRRNCSHWTSWVNENHPSTSQKGDKEFVNENTLLKFCPIGKISKFECKDNKGEPFRWNFTANDRSYFISCSDVTVGVICTVLNSTIIKFCPDMSIRYYCSCPPLNTNSTTLTVKSQANTTSPATSPTTLSISTSTTTTTTSNTKTTETLRLFPSSRTRETQLSSTTTEIFGLHNMSTMKGTSSGVMVNHTKISEPRTTETKLNVGSISITWWIFLLAVGATTFALNTGITVCLYYRLKSRLTKEKSKKTVHPLQLF